MKNKSFTPLETIGKQKKNKISLTGFTLTELMVVLIIIGVLATLGFVQYGAYKEKTLDREAQANLRLIIAAEKIYRMDTSGYYPLAGGTINDIINGINPNLRLSLSAAANRKWDYLTTADNTTSSTCGQATRTDTGARTWRMRNIEDNPVAGAICP